MQNANTLPTAHRPRRTLGQVLTAAVALVAAGAASAQSAGGFDSQTIISKIEANGATAVLIVGAMILAVWAIKSMGLFKRG